MLSVFANIFVSKSSKYIKYVCVCPFLKTPVRVCIVKHMFVSASSEKRHAKWRNNWYITLNKVSMILGGRGLHILIILYRRY